MKKERNGLGSPSLRETLRTVLGELAALELCCGHGSLRTLRACDTGEGWGVGVGGWGWG